MKTFVGKNTQLKQAAVVMQAVRPRAVITPSNTTWCATTLRIWVQISNGNITRTWFLFILSRSSEVSQPFETPGLMQGQFLQFVADNIDHNTQTLDGLNTFHGMGMISAVTPGIKCTSRRIPRVTVTAEDAAAVAKVDIHFYKNVERFNIKYETLSEIMQ